jgi:hypothetical protein
MMSAQIDCVGVHAWVIAADEREFELLAGGLERPSDPMDKCVPTSAHGVPLESRRRLGPPLWLTRQMSTFRP